MTDIDDDKNIQKLLQIRKLHFLFTIPQKAVFKDFWFFRKEQLLTGQDHIHCMHNAQLKTLCSQFNFHWFSSRKTFVGK